MFSEKTRRSVHGLSFMRDGKWCPDRTNETQKDNATGRTYANEMLAMISETNNPAIFGSVVRSITDGGRYEAVEIGFCSRIGIFIAVNSHQD